MALSERTANASGVAVDHGFHSLRVGRVVRETADATSFTLEVPAELATTFAYEAGQFCTFRVWVEDRAYVRCYSMSSSPAVDPELRVTVKRTPGGVASNWMNDHLSAGDLVEVTRPAGLFRLGEGRGDLVAFVAGSGITPVLSLVKTALATTSREVRLAYANRDRESVIFGSEIDELSRRNDGRFAVSHHLDAEQGLIGPDEIRAFAGDAPGTDYYVCGPEPFMAVVEESLLAHGVDTLNIHIERFTLEPWTPEPEAPDETAAATRVTIDLDGRTETTEYRPGTTILQTARQMGMAPPFSCEAGSCATCMARLVEGSASMHVNNALTPEEIEEGWVLTCQALPTSPQVRVTYGFED
jgi:3-ketosteroid 9alpha-monooxygenase subunit B